jgi:hypothetical protein
MTPKTISKAMHNGIAYILIDANDGGPPMALECTSEGAADCLLWNMHRMAVVDYKGKPRELDPERVIARLDGKLPANADVSRESPPNISKA